MDTSHKKRKSFGEYHHLMHDLELDEDRSRTYFRLTPNHFEEVLSMSDVLVSEKPTLTKERQLLIKRYSLRQKNHLKYSLRMR